MNNTTTFNVLSSSMPLTLTKTFFYESEKIHVFALLFIPPSLHSLKKKMKERKVCG